MSFKSKFVGDRAFYKMVLAVAVPVIVQNTITNFVSLLDNIMVGQTGTDQMNGVSVVNSILFVFNLLVWGISSGAGIFSAQFFGRGDHDGVRHTFRAKILMSAFALAAGTAVLLVRGDELIMKFLHEADGIGNASDTLAYGRAYLNIMLFGLLPLTLSFTYGNTLRSSGETKIPMMAGITAVFVNLALNWLLIFGHFGFPEMGARGAAVATVVSRFVEAGFMMFYAHVHTEKFQFMKGAWKSMRIPVPLFRKMLVKCIPLVLNETMWAAGLTILSQSYSMRGLYVVAAMNINSTISNMFNVFFFGIGEAISIIVGQLLGAGKMDEAKDTDRKMLAFSVFVCVFLGVLMGALSGVFPELYNTEDAVKRLASRLILLTAFFIPFFACMHGCYFTIRAGGRTFITFLFDSAFLWAMAVPLAFCLTRFTDFSVFRVFLLVQCCDLLKAALGVFLVSKGIWIRNVINDE